MSDSLLKDWGHEFRIFGNGLLFPVKESEWWI
jgi:hypothetical protein